jgi:dihydroorotase
VALLLKNGRVVDPATGLDEVCDIVVRDGVISEIGHDLTIPKGETVDLSEKVVLPGLVDVHVHLREPGREDEETVYSGTRAAAHGGFTALCAMPNTDPVPDEGSSIRFLVERAREHGAVRVYPVGAISVRQEGKALAEIGDMVGEGAVAVTDDGRSVPNAGMVRLAMDYTRAFDVPLVAHCEDDSLVGKGVVNEGVVSTRLGMLGWPAAAEEICVWRELRLAELTGCRLHLQHLSTAGSIELVRAAKARGVPVTCEVTPHHLFLTEDDITESYETSLKMNPPLRTAEDAAALLAGLRDGTVDCIATDHAPHAPHEKALEFELAPFGTTGLETALPLVITNLVAKKKASWADVANWMSHGPRAALGLPDIRLEVGAVADITVVDPEAMVEVTAEWFCSKSRNSAFLGAKLLGKASEVLVGGYFALRNGKVTV